MILSIGCNLAESQSIDKERMKRDLEVAENILATLVKNSKSEFQFFMHQEVDGNYVPGYGVIFNFPKGFGIPAARSIHPGSDDVIIIDRNRVIKEEGRRVTIEMNTDADSLAELQEEAMIDLMKTFLVDYGGLIGELKPEERILVVSQKDRHFYDPWDHGKGPAKTSAEVIKKDLNAYKQGKLSHAQLEERIKVTRGETPVEVPQDMELMASILDRLYRQDLSDTYYASGKVRYEYLPGFGVIYEMKVYSSIILDDWLGGEQLHNLPTLSIKRAPKSERDKKVKELYPLFIEQLKTNMASYGRTLSSLKDNEMLMIHVKLTRCTACEIPESVELSITASDLKAFASGKIQEKEVLSRISVQESGKQ